jgi:hypothetical protein
VLDIASPAADTAGVTLIVLLADLLLLRGVAVG